MTDRLVESLAERLYAAHNEWRRDLSESDSVWPLWFALDEPLKEPYRHAAQEMIRYEDEDVRRAAQDAEPSPSETGSEVFDSYVPASDLPEDD